MSSELCPVQDVCIHYKITSRFPPNNDVRNKFPCYKWITMECSKMGALAELQEYATNEVMACNIEKIRKIKRGLKNG